MSKIPKVINYCWFGKGEKSKLIKKCIESWRKYCPDYEIIEWNESNYDVTKNLYMKEAYENKKWAFVSDYARLDIIYNNGGIYLDTDVELIKGLDEILDKYESFFCFENECINTGLGFGSYKNNEIIRELLDSYNNISFIKFDGSFDLTPCPRRNQEVFNKYAKSIGCNENIVFKNTVFFPKEYFCPLDYETKKLNKTENTVGIHWYGESWLTPKKRLFNKFKIFVKKIIGVNNFKKMKKYFKGGNDNV